MVCFFFIFNLNVCGDGMLTEIVKRVGVNRTEKILASLCDKTFLGLWSFPNVYSDEGITKSKVGKEVCDLLVVFENNVIIFSDKDNKFHDNIDISVAWKRWFKKSVVGSVTQLYGAEKFIKEYPERLFLDEVCTTKFPVEFLDHMRFFLIAVTNNSCVQAKRYFDGISEGSSGTFVNIFPFNASDCMDKPFCVGDLYPSKTFVHVLDEVSLKLLLTELDTINDFIGYLAEKERVVRNGTLHTSIGEEETLATYILNNKTIVNSDDIPANSIVMIDEYRWKELIESFEYATHCSFKIGSVFWDEMIKTFSDSILSANVGAGKNMDFGVHEMVLRQLASESRYSRYILSHNFLDKLKQVPKDRRSARIIESPDFKGKYYLFLFFPRDRGQGYDEYRQERQGCMHSYALVANYKYPEIKELIIIATEPKDAEGRSEDIIYFNTSNTLTREERRLAKELMREQMVLTNFLSERNVGPNMKRSSAAIELPKVGRNEKCPCGSGEKYKKCHGK